MEAQSGRLGGVRALYAFRSRDFRLLWSARTVSLVGDGAFLIALGWRTTTLTGLGDVARDRAHGAQRRPADDGADRRRARRPLLAAAADDLLGPRQGRDHRRTGPARRIRPPLVRPAARARGGLRARGRLLLSRGRRHRAARRRVARDRVGQHADRHLAPGLVRDRPRARRLDLRRRRLGGGLRPRRDHVPRLGRSARAGTAALVRARAERGDVEVDRRGRALRRGCARGCGWGSPSRRSC